MESIIYNQKGKEAGKIELPTAMFDVKWNDEFMHQVINSMTANARVSTAHTKNRGDVSGTGKKPWKQKGTGRARHGSRRSPIWVGGGVAHGPRNDKDYSRKINKKMRAKAFFTALSQKLRDNQIIFLDDIVLEKTKTKEAKTIFDSISKIKGYEGINKRKNALFLALVDKNENIFKSFRNFGNLEIGEVKDLNPLDVLKYRYLVFANSLKSLEVLSSRTK